MLFARCEKPVTLTDCKSSCGKPEGVRSESSGSKVDLLYFHDCSAAVFLRSCHQELVFSFPFCTLVCSSTGQRWNVSEQRRHRQKNGKNLSGGMFTQTEKKLCFVICFDLWLRGVSSLSGADLKRKRRQRNCIRLVLLCLFNALRDSRVFWLDFWHGALNVLLISANQRQAAAGTVLTGTGNYFHIAQTRPRNIANRPKFTVKNHICTIYDFLSFKFIRFCHNSST